MYYLSDIRTCERADCEESFEPKTHNQIFCTAECCRIETNRKIMEKYHEKAAIRRGKTRMCKSCQVTKLSRYNADSICSSCQEGKRVNYSNQVTAFLGIVTN